MSVSPMARQVVSTQAIPIKRVLVNDPSEMPGQYSQTPGGTMFSTTPGGTKIIYEKNYLLNLRNSPISRTPPTYDIPDNLVKGSGSSPKKYNQNNNHSQRKPNLPPRKRNDSYNNRKNTAAQDDDDQFQIDL